MTLITITRKSTDSISDIDIIVTTATKESNKGKRVRAHTSNKETCSRCHALRSQWNRGDIKCALHAYYSYKSDNTSYEREFELFLAYRKIFEEADSNRCLRMALPTLGMEAFDGQREKWASLILQMVLIHVEENRTQIQEVFISCEDEDVFSIFKKIMKRNTVVVSKETARSTRKALCGKYFFQRPSASGYVGRKAIKKYRSMRNKECNSTGCTDRRKDRIVKIVKAELFHMNGVDAIGSCALPADQKENVVTHKKSRSFDCVTCVNASLHRIKGHPAIIHAKEPKMDNGKVILDKDDMSNIMSCYRKIFKAAETSGRTTLALPIIGIHLPVETSVLINISIQAALLAHKSSRKMKEIIFVHGSDDIVNAFREMIYTDALVLKQSECQELRKVIGGSMYIRTAKEAAKKTLSTAFRRLMAIGRRQRQAQATSGEEVNTSKESSIRVELSRVSSSDEDWRQRTPPQVPERIPAEPSAPPHEESDDEDMDDEEDNQPSTSTAPPPPKRRRRKASEETKKKKRKAAAARKQQTKSGEEQEKEKKEAREKMRRSRSKQTSEESESTKEEKHEQAAVSRKRTRRRSSLSETDEEAEERHIREAAGRRQSHGRETDQEVQERKKKDREHQRERRSCGKEAETQAEERKRKNRERQQEQRRQMTQEQRAAVNKTRRQARRKSPERTLMQVNVEPHYLGPFEFRCPYCNATQFKTTTLGCCKQGKVFIEELMPPEFLYKLLTEKTPEANEFRRNSMRYNNLFAMAALEYNKVSMPAGYERGPPVIKLQGTVYYHPCDLRSPGIMKPKYGQYYIYDPEAAAELRNGNDIHGDHVNPETVKKLSKIFAEVNYLAKQYRSMNELLEIKKKENEIGNFFMVMKTPTEEALASVARGSHPGTLERPKQESLSAIFDITSQDVPRGRGLWVFEEKRDKPRSIPYWSEMVDPLCFPLIFPYGTAGYKWHEKKYRRADERVKIYERHPQEEERVEEASDEQEESMEATPRNEDENHEEEGELHPTREPEDHPGRSEPETLQSMLLSSDDEADDSPDIEMDADERREVPQQGEVHQDDPDPEFRRTLEQLARGEADTEPIPVDELVRARDYVSRREHILYLLQIRDKIYHRISSTEKVGQLFVVDNEIRIELERDRNLRKHLTEKKGLKANSPGFRAREAIAKQMGVSLVMQTIVPKSVPGSMRHLRQAFDDAITMINQIGKPCLFVTFTANPKWREIQEALDGKSWQNYPQIVNEVYNQKRKDLLEYIKKIWKVKGVVWSNEFQKRGLPHMHCLITMEEGHKFDNVEMIDKWISAVIPPKPTDDDPDRVWKEELRRLVIDFHLHMPCKGDPTAYCNLIYKKGKAQCGVCGKHFPKPFSYATSLLNDGYAQLRRPNDGEKVTKKNAHGQQVEADNSYVIPYCPELLMRYKTHCNVEVVSKILVVKYIFKYIFKGFDKALVQFVESMSVDSGSSIGAVPQMQNVVVGSNMFLPKHQKIDEKTREILARCQAANEERMKEQGIFRKAGDPPAIVYDEATIMEQFREMTACEAAYRIAGYELLHVSHVIINLGVHLEGEQFVLYSAEKFEEVAEKVREGKIVSELMAWFELNQRDPEARQYSYAELPQHYVLHNNRGYKKWSKRKRSSDMILSRVRPVSPRYLETFALRLLTMVKPSEKHGGPLCFNDLKRIDDNKFAATFIEAARAKGLMEDTNEWEKTLEDAVSREYPALIRRLFATIIVFGHPKNPDQLWQKYKKYMVDREQLSPESEKRALYHINSILYHHNLDVKTAFIVRDMPDFTTTKNQLMDENLDMDFGVPMTTTAQAAKADEMKQSFTETQKAFAEDIRKAMMFDDDEHRNRLFFLSGSGGSGKSYLYNYLFHKYTSLDYKVVMVAHTGIAATLLETGQTAHRRFMLPLNITENGRSNMDIGSPAAKELASAHLFIYDEATMADKFVFEAVDHLLREVTGNDDPFGGKVFIFGGDWKQLLPVIKNVRGESIVDYTLKGHTKLWSKVQVRTLAGNQRAKDSQSYRQFLEDLGNGRHMHRGRVDIDDGMMCETEEEVINFVYPPQYFKKNRQEQNVCLLTITNNESMAINEEVLSKVQGPMRTYTSIDMPTETNGMQFAPEYFHDELGSGMPPHKLNLKIGSVVILLRNLDVKGGLCNGTRMVVLAMFDHYVRCRIIGSKSHQNVEAIIPRTKLTPADSDKKVKYTRLQLPLRLAYAMTINKAQGQSFDRVGVILRNNVFLHGQLYVGFSRVPSFDSFRMSKMKELLPGEDKDRNFFEDSESRLGAWVTNVVYPQVLDPAVNDPNAN